MDLMAIRCTECGSDNLRVHMTYTILSGENRKLYQCKECETYFSETKNSALAGLRTPLSKISTVLHALNEGMGINAASRVHNVAKNSIYTWLDRLTGVKETLLLYALCHQFVQQTVEGDEVYTRVNKNKPPTESEGWTIILMERASRFIWELECDEKTESLFTHAMQTLAQVIEQTDDLSLFTDGERRYGNILFAICSDVIRTGKRGRPASTLPKDVHVRIKNKGQQNCGPQRPKYQDP